MNQTQSTSVMKTMVCLVMMAVCFASGAGAKKTEEFEEVSNFARIKTRIYRLREYGGGRKHGWPGVAHCLVVAGGFGGMAAAVLGAVVGQCLAESEEPEEDDSGYVYWVESDDDENELARPSRREHIYTAVRRDFHYV